MPHLRSWLCRCTSSLRRPAACCSPRALRSTALRGFERARAGRSVWGGAAERCPHALLRKGASLSRTPFSLVAFGVLRSGV
eukprot:624796-Rhodomonas_salina.1